MDGRDFSPDDETIGLLTVIARVIDEHAKIKSFELVSTSTVDCSKVIRSSDAVKALHQTLEQQYSDIFSCPTLDTESLNEASVQDYLNLVVGKLGENLFLCPTLMEFLDDNYGHSGIIKLQSDYLFCHLRSMQGQMDKLEENNAKLFALIEGLTSNSPASCLSVIQQQCPSEDLAARMPPNRRTSEPQLTARNLNGGSAMHRRFSLKRRSSLVSNVTSISATSAMSDDCSRSVEGAPTFSTAFGRRPSQVTDISDFGDDYDFVDEDRNLVEPSPLADSDRGASISGLSLGQTSPISQERTIFGVGTAAGLGRNSTTSSSPSQRLDSLGPITNDSCGDNAGLESGEKVIVPIVSAAPQRSQSVLARLWQMSGNVFETIMEEEEAPDKTKGEPETTSNLSHIVTSDPSSKEVSEPLSPPPPGFTRPDTTSLAPFLVGVDIKSTQLDSLAETVAVQNITAVGANPAESQQAPADIVVSNSVTGSTTEMVVCGSDVADKGPVGLPAMESSAQISTGASQRPTLDEAVPIHFTPLCADQLNSDLAPICRNYSNECFVESQVPSALYARSSVLEFELIPVNKTPNALDESINELLSILQPHPEQIAYRGSMQSMLTRWLRRLLGVRVLDCSLHGIRCFLPDDGIKLGLFLPPSSKYATTWPTMFGEKLLRLSEGSDLIIQDEYEELKIPLCFQDDGLYPIIVDHVISAVSTHGPQHPSTISPNATYIPTQLHTDLILAVMLDAIQVEIVGNPKVDVAMLAFLEEMAVLVGKDHLFKRSMILIRAWWTYETTAYVGAPIKHYLPEVTIAVMVTAIFNQYHHRIFYPLQALTIFLAEYSAVDWGQQCITVQGIVPFESEVGKENEPCYKQPADTDLLSDEAMQKYFDMIFCDMPETYPAQPVVVVDTPRSGETQGNDDQKTIILVHQPFERGLMNIAHPLTGQNLVSKDYLVSRRLARVTKAFETAAKTLNVTLRLATQNNMAGQSAIQGFFRGLSSRFGTGWRPDVVANTMVMSSSLIKQRARSNKSTKDSDISEELQRLGETLRSKLDCSWDNMWNQLHYCTLLVAGIVSDQAVIFFCKDVLQDRGALPVGEVGKILQDTTAAFQLSTKLKEKYGGLKKFLELYESEFVMSLEHPFNPHVFIRHGLSKEELESISKNIIPPAYSYKAKKMQYFHGRKGKGGYVDSTQWQGQTDVATYGLATQGGSPVGHQGKLNMYHQSMSHQNPQYSHAGVQYRVGQNDYYTSQQTGNAVFDSRKYKGGTNYRGSTNVQGNRIEGGYAADPRYSGSYEVPNETVDHRFDGQYVTQGLPDGRQRDGRQERGRNRDYHQMRDTAAATLIRPDGMDSYAALHGGYHNHTNGYNNGNGHYDRDVPTPAVVGVTFRHRPEEYNLQSGYANPGSTAGRYDRNHSSCGYSNRGNNVHNIHASQGNGYVNTNRIGPQPIPTRTSQYSAVNPQVEIKDKSIFVTPRGGIPSQSRSGPTGPSKVTPGTGEDNLLMHPLLAGDNTFSLGSLSTSNGLSKQVPVSTGLFSSGIALGLNESSLSDDSTILGGSLMSLASSSSTSSSRSNRTEDASLLEHILSGSLNDNFDYPAHKF